MSNAACAKSSVNSRMVATASSAIRRRRRMPRLESLDSCPGCDCRSDISFLSDVLEGGILTHFPFMNPIDLILNPQTGLLRSGWRAAIFLTLVSSPYLIYGLLHKSEG